MRTPGSRTAVLLLILTAAAVFGQPKSADRPRAFPSISFEAVPAPLTPGQSGAVTLNWAPLRFENGRLTGLDNIYRIVEFACFDLLTPYRMEPTGRGRPIRPYRIDATLPRGTTLDEVRAMLRLFLTERLHLRYHLSERPTPFYHLVRGRGELKLDPARPLPPGPHPGAMWLLNSYAQPVGNSRNSSHRSSAGRSSTEPALKDSTASRSIGATSSRRAPPSPIRPWRSEAPRSSASTSCALRR